MRHAARYCAGLLVLTPIFSACSSDPAKVEANVFPTEYKKLIIESLKKDRLIGAREASITDPTLRQIDNSERYAVCVRYNPRLSDSPGYIGALFTSTRVTLPSSCRRSRSNVRGQRISHFPSLRRRARVLDVNNIDLDAPSTMLTGAIRPLCVCRRRQ
jgi:hypothetical protein